MVFDNLLVQMQPGGLIQGAGSDTVGKFTVSGSFSSSSPTGRFVKQYEGKHAVYYEGVLNQQERTIDGTWGLQPG
jgi:hypothetical protein